MPNCLGGAKFVIKKKTQEREMRNSEKWLMLMGGKMVGGGSLQVFEGTEVQSKKNEFQNPPKLFYAS